MELASIALQAAFLLIAVNLISLMLAFVRLTPRPRHRAAQTPVPVSVVIPVRGIETYSQETLERAFNLDWPDYELLFCVADAEDQIGALVRQAMARHPNIQARLLIGDDHVSGNPKLNNCIKGWHAARHDWVVLADSNVLMPRDYIQRLRAVWRTGETGLVCSMPLGSRPQGFWSEVECAFLNTFAARWQYAGEAVGRGFAQGKSMLWNKPLLDANGGLEALGEEIAEDAAATKLVNGLGLKVHLVDAPFEQPLGRRTLGEVWSRQARWARLRRVTFPLFYAPEAVLGAVAPLVLGCAAALASEGNIFFTGSAVLLSFYGPEYALAWANGWTRGPRYIGAMMVRDLMMPAIAVCAWIGLKVEWRGNAMDIHPHAHAVK